MIATCAVDSVPRQSDATEGPPSFVYYIRLSSRLQR